MIITFLALGVTELKGSHQHGSGSVSASPTSCTTKARAACQKQFSRRRRHVDSGRQYQSGPAQRIKSGSAGQKRLFHANFVYPRRRSYESDSIVQHKWKIFLNVFLTAKKVEQSGSFPTVKITTLGSYFINNNLKKHKTLQIMT